MPFYGNTIDTETPTSSTFTTVTTSPYPATSSSMDLKLLNISGPPLASTEVDSLIDLVTVTDIGPATALPEPAGPVLLLTGLALVALRKRRASQVRG